MPRVATPKQQETRARRTLVMMLSALSGALVSDASVHGDYRMEVRAATTRVRQALDRGESAHEALRAHIVPLFAVDDGVTQ